MARRFTHAVAFHGFDDEPGVLIGGTAPADLKEGLRLAIQQVLPVSLAVRVALPEDRYGGDDPNNVVKQVALMLSLARCGEINESVMWADKIQQNARDASAFYLAATGYAVCAGKLATDPSLVDGGSAAAEQYATKSIDTLREATRRGYQFSQEQLLDPDLRSLHGRMDFAALFPQQ
jgi:hypothetical protein